MTYAIVIIVKYGIFAELPADNFEVCFGCLGQAGLQFPCWEDLGRARVSFGINRNTAEVLTGQGAEFEIR